MFTRWEYAFETLRLAEVNKSNTFLEKLVNRLGKVFGRLLILLLCVSGVSFAQG